MEYMYSINANNGSMALNGIFGISTSPTIDQVLMQMKEGQAAAQLPSSVTNYGVTVEQAASSPLIVFALFSPDRTFDAAFLANYANINISNELARVPGVGQVNVYGAGQYAMRFWVRPDRLAKLNVTVNEIVQAVQVQNTVNPAGQIGGAPVPPGQEFTYTVIAKGRLVTPEEFGDIIVREDPDGSIIKLKDVARIELGEQTYNLIGRYNGSPAAVVVINQQPGSNALDTVKQLREKMITLSKRFPSSLQYDVALDTTLAITAAWTRS